MEPTDLPNFQSFSWRWIAYATSTLLIAATAFAFLHEIELKQDVQGEVISPSDIKIQGLSGLVSAIHVHESERVEAGTPLFALEKNLSLSTMAGNARCSTKRCAAIRSGPWSANTPSEGADCNHSWKPRG